ncbi:MAG: hypothetical protein Ta2A_25240 [Treponemataceae bacterium]|nr:MAG: hypothetical protein Ta2A_25240 [Treponemataceae bacterium]
MKLTTKRFFTVSFLAISALFFMTIAGCKNLALRDVLRSKSFDSRVTDTSLKSLLVTMYYFEGWKTMTYDGTQDANQYGEYVVNVSEKEKVEAVRVTAVTRVQGDDKIGQEGPLVSYDPPGGYEGQLTYDSLVGNGGSYTIQVVVTSIDGSTTDSYDVVFRAESYDDPYA